MAAINTTLLSGNILFCIVLRGDGIARFIGHTKANRDGMANANVINMSI